VVGESVLRIDLQATYAYRPDQPRYLGRVAVIQALPLLTLIAPFFAVFIVSHFSYVKVCRELYAEKEVKKMSIPDKQTDLSVGSFEEQYARGSE
jgi:hypothetical protein